MINLPHILIQECHNSKQTRNFIKKLIGVGIISGTQSKETRNNILK